MTDIILIAIGAALGLVILMMIVWALCRYPDLPLWERVGMGLFGAGIVWGGINRLTGRPIDLGDIMLLAGAALIMWRYAGLNPKIEGVK